MRTRLLRRLLTLLISPVFALRPPPSSNKRSLSFSPNLEEILLQYWLKQWEEQLNLHKQAVHLTERGSFEIALIYLMKGFSL
ncbi:hypothetical protein L1987_10522 [Smallanthus sonchifolius]|uniref:Uncharacterized protein n=1 Tax=Smallanthus sonchifolius TaxID=185202 RepID=A0ACB9JSA7_9ASTR|nr:hypothetical protein L1987_10522 [Smallanthus sonchifolius]